MSGSAATPAPKLAQIVERGIARAIADAIVCKIEAARADDAATAPHDVTNGRQACHEPRRREVTDGR